LQVLFSFCPQLLKDTEALEFWELGNVQTIVVEQHLRDAVAIVV
jgi:hypothetical protein